MKRLQQTSIFSFIGNKKNKSADVHESKLSESSSNPSSPSCSSGLNVENVDLPKLSETVLGLPLEISESNSLDVGNFINVVPVDDYLKLEVLTNCWTPSESYIFPVSENRHLSFQRNWLNLYQWLAYSEKVQGALCRICVLFSQRVGGKGRQDLGSLVVRPFCNWKKAKETFELHQKKDYHINATLKAENFKSVVKGTTSDVASMLDSVRERQAKDNREKLKPIVETILMCGRQEIALRGTNDAGPVGLEEPTHNDGNFRALLRYRAKGQDSHLLRHLQSQHHDSRSMYTSPTIQNELIEICGDLVQENIISRVKIARYFAILVDETQDISRKQQLSLCVRYIDSKKKVVREDFLCFVIVNDVTALGLTNTILSALNTFNLDLGCLVGQGYDGAAVMSGQFKGVRSLISGKYPRAKFVHCSAHTLNLVIAHSCEIPIIRNCIGTVKSVINFFRISSLRTDVLDGIIKNTGDSKRHKTLLGLCETRWTEKHESLARFVDLYEHIVEALEALQEKTNKDTAVQALQLASTITKSEFIIALLTLNKVFSYTSNLTKNLQKVNVDLVACVEHVDLIVQSIQSSRDSCDQSFSIIYKQVEKLVLNMGGEIRKPRTVVSRQTQRGNVPAENAEQYYLRNLYIPFIDHVIVELKDRFSEHHKLISFLQLLIPEKCIATETKPAIFIHICELYDKRFDLFTTEFHMWQNKWIHDDNVPRTAIEAFLKTDGSFFPIIKDLLQILATLPCSTATPERSFSTLRRLKSWLRNSILNERLNGLALLSVHREIYVSSEDVINRFCLKKRNIVL